jgi:trimethylamine corrinoid protein
MPDLIRHPVRSWIMNIKLRFMEINLRFMEIKLRFPAFAGMTIKGQKQLCTKSSKIIRVEKVNRRMDKEQLLEKLAAAVVDGAEDEAISLARAAVADKFDPLEAIDQGLSKGMEIIGVRFECGDAYLPELLRAAAAFNAAMTVLKPEIEAQKKQIVKLGKVLIGTVKGDVHSIGKDIVASVLDTGGFEVIDIGVDNPSVKIIQEAERVQADVIALSSMMTTTMPAQREVIDKLKEKGVREKYFVIIGGGPVNQEWADRIGADGYGKSAIDAVTLVKGLMARKKEGRIV